MLCCRWLSRAEMCHSSDSQFMCQHFPPKLFSTTDSFRYIIKCCKEVFPLPFLYYLSFCSASCYISAKKVRDHIENLFCFLCFFFKKKRKNKEALCCEMNKQYLRFCTIICELIIIWIFVYMLSCSFTEDHDALWIISDHAVKHDRQVVHKIVESRTSAEVRKEKGLLRHSEVLKLTFWNEQRCIQIRKILNRNICICGLSCYAVFLKYVMCLCGMNDVHALCLIFTSGSRWLLFLYPEVKT